MTMALSPQPCLQTTTIPPQQQQPPPTPSNVRVVGRIRPLAGTLPPPQRHAYVYVYVYLVQQLTSSHSSCLRSSYGIIDYELEKGCQQVVQALDSTLGTRTTTTTTLTSTNDHKLCHNIAPDPGPQQLFITPPDTTTPDGGDNKRWFELDAVLDGSCTQEHVYVQSGAKQAVCHDLFQGFNCTILAYGQTGAGKTFTMGTAPLNGNDNNNNNNDDHNNSSTISKQCGIIPRACADLYEQIQQRCDGNATVELQYMEVYNEEIRDLVTDKPQTHLRIRENLQGQVYVRGLQSRKVQSPQDIGRCMMEASKRRMVASTKMNATSSRSHAICVLKLQGVLCHDDDDDQNGGGGGGGGTTKFESKLTLVDLAGSERIKKTGAQGNRAQEGISINKGLFVLGQVVSALAEQRPKMKRKPPYRDSKLTRLLQDSLGGNSRTIMVACVSPADFNVEESINTLRYATSARNIKNTATRNVVENLSPEAAAKLRRENDLLKQQVKELEAMVEKLTMDLEEQAAAAVEHAHSVAVSATSGNSSELPPVDESSDSPERTTRSNDTDKDESESSKGGLAAFLEAGGPKKSYEELEKENANLRAALQNTESDMKSVAAESTALRSLAAESAIELPKMKVMLRMLEDELSESHAFEEEAEELRRELEQTKAEATAARHAADHLTHVVEEQLSMSQRSMEYTGDDLEEKRIEYDKIVTAEEWVNMVAQIFSAFKEQMRQLGDFYALVIRIVDSPDIIAMIPPKPKPVARRGSLWGGGTSAVDAEKEKLERKKEELELREKLLSEHVQFYNEKFLETEDIITSRAESLEEIQDLVRQQKEELEEQLGTAEFMRNMFFGTGEETIHRLSKVLEIDLGAT